MKFNGISIGVPSEIMPEEKRVSVTPETAGQFIKEGASVLVEAGAGSQSFYEDSQYEKAGAKIMPTAEDVYSGADIILKVKEPIFSEKLKQHEADMIKSGSILVTFLHPANPANHQTVKKLAQRKITSFTLDSIPRISRAQQMDALTSMSTIAGYRAVISGAYSLKRLIPMVATPSGVIGPSNVLVAGAGVAGLQAVATAKRLGAKVKAIDIRAEACEQAKSLGAELIDFKVPPKLATGQGGYALRLPEKWYRLERKILGPHLAESDLVILSALIPRQSAPILVTEDMVKGMKRGSVIVDISIDQGGNCELTREGQEYDCGGVFISGVKNMPAYLAIDSTRMFAQNVYHYLSHIFDKGSIDFGSGDEVIAMSLVTRDGEIVHSPTLDAIK